MNKKTKKILFFIVYFSIFGVTLLFLSVSILANEKTSNFKINYLGNQPLTHWGGEGALFFINKSTGWLGGSAFSPKFSGVLKTKDYGNTWQFSNMSNTQVPYDEKFFAEEIQFLNDTHGYLLLMGEKYSDYLLKTVDGGNNWQYIKLNSCGSVQAMYFFNFSNGIVTNNSGVSVTDDCGDSWSFYPNSYNLNYLDFTNSTYGYALGSGLHPDSKQLYFTNDSGINWYLRNNIGFKCVNFINSTNGWAVELIENFNNHNDTHRIIYTSNGGESWTESYRFDHQSMRMFIKVTSENHICVATSDDIYTSINGGSSWNYSNIELTWNTNLISDLFFYDSNTGWILCEKIYADLFGNELHESLILTTLDGGLSWDLASSVKGQIEGYNHYLTVLPYFVIDNSSYGILIMLTIFGFTTSIIVIIVMSRKERSPIWTSKLPQEEKYDKKEEIKQKDSISEGYIGLNDSSLEFKIKNLISSQTPIDLITNKELLAFFEKEFNLLSPQEINRVLKLKNIDFHEKIIILEEISTLPLNDREVIIKNLEKYKEE
ncbi:MAG: WD40/YVTN/BNR-like repeat-containing protein [Candidatus Helarchaeota archaeon]